MASARPIRVGLISDTHGLLRPEAANFLRGADLILHAGDVCERRVLDELASIAPTTAVRGNNDRGPWADALAEEELVQVGGALVCVVHDLATLSIDPGAAGVRVVVHGHSHSPLVEERGGVLFVNPGSAGPRRFKLPISVGELMIDGSETSARIRRVDAVESRG